MKVSDLIKFGGYKVITKSDFEDRNVTGCYTGDLLSWVMGKAESGDVWITVMSNINIVAVASLTDTACIVLAEDVNIDDDVLNKANAQDVIILQTPKTSSEAVMDFYRAAEKYNA